MVNPTGFIEFQRAEVGHRPIRQRIRDWEEIDQPLTDRVLNQQAARCMDCGIPFCHGIGCPVKNRIPEFNDLVYRVRHSFSLSRSTEFPRARLKTFSFSSSKEST